MRYRVWELVKNKAVTNEAADVVQAYEWRDSLAADALAAGLILTQLRYGLRRA